MTVGEAPAQGHSIVGVSPNVPGLLKHGVDLCRRAKIIQGKPNRATTCNRMEPLFPNAVAGDIVTYRKEVFSSQL